MVTIEPKQSITYVLDLKVLIFSEQNFKNAIFGPVGNFKQASKQNRMIGSFLEI